MNMVFTLLITVFYIIFEAIGLLGNLLVITTIFLESRFHVMRYVALASLAVSDFLYLILVPSFRIASMVQGRWPFGEMLCNLNTNFARYFYFNTILHLIVVSYDRYLAIVKSPLTYDGTISTAKKVSLVINWIVPIPFFITPILRGRKFHYNPLVFKCEEGLWSSPFYLGKYFWWSKSNDFSHLFNCSATPDYRVSQLVGVQDSENTH